MKPLLLTMSVLSTLLSPALSAADTPPAVSPLGTPPAVARPGIVGGSWMAERIGGLEVTEPARSFVRFDSAELVSGNAGINRFGGSCTLLADKLSFGALRVTRMAGPAAMMDQEAKFLAALAKVAGFKLDENDHLQLLDKDGLELVRLARFEGDAHDVVTPPQAPRALPDER